MNQITKGKTTATKVFGRNIDVNAIIQLNRDTITAAGFNHQKEQAALHEFRKTFAQQFDPRGFEVGEKDRVIDVAIGVKISETNFDFGR